MRRLLLSIVTLASLALAVGVVAPVASAHSARPLYNPDSCYGTIRNGGTTAQDEAACDHFGPTSTQGECGTSFSTIDSENWTDHGGAVWQVQIRYSSACQSRWARLVAISSPGSCMYNSYLSIARTQTNKTTDSMGGTGISLCDGAYTNMLYSPNNGSSTWQTQAESKDTLCGGAGYATWIPTTPPNVNFVNGYDFC